MYFEIFCSARPKIPESATDKFTVPPNLAFAIAGFPINQLLLQALVFNIDKRICMDSFKVNNLTAFVPSKNFQLGCMFYEDLGFRKIVDIGSAFRYEINGCSFWLQNYYVKEWADNCMLCLYVECIDHWHEKIVNLDLGKNYGGLAKVLSEPHADEHGSLIMNITDPSGVLWHFYQGA